MNIKGIHIYGYGQHENMKLSFHGGIQVLYGENESGKSTIRSFIRSVLYGFPLRTQTEERLEPRPGVAFGGKLFVFDEKKGNVEIERVYRKSATGDVTVRFEDGSTAGEEALQQLIGYCAKDVFQQIYYFSIFDLQQIEGVPEEEFTRLLLSTSAIGSNKLQSLQKKGNDIVQTLYKPTGRKPLLNVDAERLQRLADEEARHQEKGVAYYEYVRNLQKLEQMIEALHDQLQEKRNERVKLHVRLQQYELFHQYEAIHRQIKEHNHFEHMTEGSFAHLEEVLQREKKMQAQWDQLDEQIAQLEVELSNQFVTNHVLYRERKKIEQFYERYQRHTLIEEEMKRRKEREQQCYKELKRHAHTISPYIDVHAILQCDTSLVNKEYLRQVEQQLQKYDEEKERCIEKEENLCEHITQLERQRHGKEERKNQSIKPWVGIGTAIFVLSVVSFFLFSLLTAFFVGGLLSLSAFMLYLYSYERSIRHYDNKLVTPQQIEELEKQREQCIEQLETIHNEMFTLRKERTVRFPLISLLKVEEQLNFQVYMTSIEHMQGIERERMELQTIVQAYEKEKANLKEKWLNFLIDVSLTDAEFISIERCYQVMKEEERIAIYRETKEKERERLVIQQKKYREECSKLQLQMKENGHHVGIYSLQNFYEKREVWEQWKRWKHEAEILLQDLQKMDSFLQMSVASEQQLKEELYHIEDQVTSLQNQLEENEKKRAHQKGQMDQLEAILKNIQGEEETSELTSRIQKQLKQYLAWQLLLRSMTTVQNQYQEDILPDFLKRATTFFQQMTLQQYEAIYIQKSTITVQHRDGSRYTPSQLSQGTKEQLFLAVRFALAVEMNEVHGMPFLMDDPFVHFDTSRLQGVRHVLQKLADKQQIILFTCHRHVRNEFHEYGVQDLLKERVGG